MNVICKVHVISRVIFCYIQDLYKIIVSIANNKSIDLIISKI